MKTLLVTGGSGFIGSHLCEELLKRKNQVICVDNFFTGSFQNIEHLKNNPHFEIIRHDITLPLYLEVDQIYNLACPASPIHYQYNPIKTIKCNTVGMVNMLGLAKRTKARLLQASTSEVYGNPLEHPQKETYWGNVNPIGVRSCFVEDTEVLTKDGFKFFKEVNAKDEIATLNEKGFLEYHFPTEIIKQEYKGEMIHFSNSKVDIIVTPNHYMYVQPRRENKEEKFKLIPAFEAINWKRAKMQKAAQWQAPEQEYFCLPAVDNNKFGNITKIKMDDWLEFFGYYITEGCVHLRRRNRIVKGKLYLTIDYNILIAQDRKNIPERRKIENCLQRLPFNYFDSDDHQFRICNKQLALYLSQFGKSKEKYIPPELKNVSERQLKILFEAMMLGDGSKRGDSYYTNSPRLAGDFQEILLKLGMATNSSVKDKRKKTPIYHLHLLTKKNKNFLTPRYPARSIVDYNGFVYCLNVKNHIIYVRRKGKVLFCGNCYDEGKRVAETLCMDYHRQNKVDIRLVRIFNTYGPRMAENDGRVVSNFILQALRNEPITIYGNGQQTRSFQYVSDLIEGMIKMMEQDDFIGPVNLGNPKEFTMLDLAHQILKLTGSKSSLVFKELPQDDPVRRQPDISLAKEKLNWSPVIDLETGLKKTIEYFRERLNQDRLYSPGQN